MIVPYSHEVDINELYMYDALVLIVHTSKVCKTPF